MRQCQYCGCKDGYYEKLIESRALFYTWDGEGEGASEPDTVRGGARQYCRGCGRDVTKYISACECEPPKYYPSTYMPGLEIKNE